MIQPRLCFRTSSILHYFRHHTTQCRTLELQESSSYQNSWREKCKRTDPSPIGLRSACWRDCRSDDVQRPEYNTKYKYNSYFYCASTRRKNCHVVKRLADKKQHTRAALCEGRAWWIKRIYTEDTVCWDTIQGSSDILTACDKDITIWTTFLEERISIEVYGLLEGSILNVFCKKNKCSLSRNGMFCRHETTCTTRDVVQRSVLKAFLLGRNTCWMGFAEWCYGWVFTSEYRFKIGDFTLTGVGYPKSSGRRGRSH